MNAISKPLWQPTPEQVAAASITNFTQKAESQWGRTFDDYQALHNWSVEQPEEFWISVWDFCGILAATRGNRVLERLSAVPGARFFPDARLNFARNLLHRRDEGLAICFRSEDQVERSLTYVELYLQVAKIARGLQNAGIEPGDRVCAYMPNMPETVIAMLATTAIGAVWSSCSPDFGVQGVLDRFGQIKPRILFSADGYYYNGKQHDSLTKLAEIREGLPSVEQAVVAPLVASQPMIGGVRDAVLWNDFSVNADNVEFIDLPFNHPLYILYSSGTTGAPKCIVHGAGGSLLQHLKEHRLHVDLYPGDRFFYFTTCGWMMWNWLVSGLASGATLMLYDGSPFYPDENVLFDFAAEQSIQIFGTSAKFLDAAAKAGICPRKTHDLRSLRTLLSTGSPLIPESFDFVYESIKKNICLSSISGGTDIVGCFVGGNPTLPVWQGEIQCRLLGMQVEVRNDDGIVLGPGEKGELTCSNAFPSMPVSFWNDAKGDRYRAAYFEKFPKVWCHGDYVAATQHDGMIVYGRSDATLNPGGVRIGTAEIYRQAEQVDEVVESLAVGQSWEGDVRIVLFVRLREGLTLNESLSKQIRDRIRQNTTPRHVPARVIQVSDIPRTRSGKIVELAVQRIIDGEPARNRDVLANPEALDLFVGLSELEH
jgi:acetoacetyl-CoA synthetase